MCLLQNFPQFIVTHTVKGYGIVNKAEIDVFLEGYLSPKKNLLVFPVVMYGCESWTIKKAEHQRIDAFELWCWRRLLRVPWTAAHQASPSITNSQSLPKLIFIESVMSSNHLILCRSLLLLPSIFPSIRVFSNESVLSHQVAKVLELQLQHQSFQ